MGLILALIIGAIAGFLAGKFMSGRGFGLIGDTVIGLIGGLIGDLLFGLLGLQANGSILGELIVAFIGACILLAIAKAIKAA